MFFWFGIPRLQGQIYNSFQSKFLNGAELGSMLVLKLKEWRITHVAVSTVPCVVSCNYEIRRKQMYHH